MEFDDLSGKVIHCALEVHRALGPGLLESAYQQCVARELTLRQISFQREAPVAISYKGLYLECGYRLDFLLDNKLILELKSVDALSNLHEAQVLTYMRLAGVKVGLLINFNVPVLKVGIRRLVL